MWLAFKAKHFECIEHNFLSNGLKNESFVLQPFPLKFQNFEIFVWFSFLSIVWFYAFLLITLKTIYILDTWFF
jgi:hypothetical protein